MYNHFAGANKNIQKIPVIKNSFGHIFNVNDE